MNRLKDEILQSFKDQLESMQYDPSYLSKDLLEIKLNTIVENIVEKLNLDNHIFVPLKQTTNENDLDVVELENDKSGDIELSDDFNSAKSSYGIKENQPTTIPNDFRLTYEMEQYAKSKYITDIYATFEDFKLYYQSKATLNSDWEAVWKRWILNNNKYKNHLVKTTVDENMKLSSSMKEFAKKYIKNDMISLEFKKFLNHYSANGDLKVSWEKVWENWCMNHKNFTPKEQTAQAKQKAAYKWDFKKAKETSDKIKDWLEFEKGINWLEDYYLKDIPIPHIGWQEVQHPDFNKEEILLYKIDSQSGQFMIERKNDDIIEVKVLEND